MSTPRHAVPTPPKKRSLVARTADSVPVMESQPLVLPFCPGDVIAGKYEVVGALGAGGVAYVISALHLELGEMVALKFLRPESLAHEEVVARFASEARAVARIKSEHVAHVFDVGTLSDGAPFIVMEYLEGKDLGVVLAERGSLPIKLAVDYVLQACEALACAHAGGIVHRDIKPDNLFLTQAVGSVEVVKVLDFGISKSALAAVELGARRRANTMLPMGTPGYMSPEQIRDCGGVDARTDVWSLGCVLSELVTGKSVFDAPTVPQLTATILERDPIPLRKLLPEAPQALEALILKCLEKDPARRFQDVAELAVALYPFGPRRARVSAERCHNVLKGQQGMVIELSSVAPPPMSGSNTPMPVSSTGPVVSAVPASLPSPEPVRTSTPATVTMAASPAPKSRTKLMAGAALTLAVVTLALGLNARRFGSSDARAPAAAPPAVASPTATAPPVVVGRGESKTPDEPTVGSGAHGVAPGDAASEPVPTSVSPAKASRIKRVTKTQVTRAVPAASKPPAPSKKRAVVDDAEPDVGY